MATIIKNISFLTIVAATILFVSCSDKQNQAPAGDIFDEANIPAAEKILLEAVNVRDTERVRTLADSLEQTGDISAVTANYYRGASAIYQDNLKEAESYLKLATANRNPKPEDLRSYLQSSALLARLYSAGGKHEEALTEALPTLAIMDSLGFNQSVSDLTLLNIVIGVSQQSLQQPKEASATFEKTYQMLRNWMDNDSTGKEIPRVITRLDNIATSYFNTAQYAEAKKWIDREDSALTIYANSPAATPEQVDMFRGSISLDLAQILQELGQPDEAARYYNQFLTTDFSKSDLSRINAVDYLFLAGRYDEAADNFEVLDHVMNERGFDLSLDNIGLYLLPKMRANILAERKDSALAVGMKIVECYDSALNRQKHNEAAELATIYDTQGKERQIAEQEMRLSRIRTLAFVVSIIALTVFFVIFTIIRHRAAQRLAGANNQLEVKNKELTIAREKAEEASKMKTNFIMQISHEIRTPLNAVCGFSQVITMPGMEFGEEELAEINNGIVENTERITGLVNKMLELSDANSQTVIEKNDDVAVVDIASGAVSASGIEQAQHLTFEQQLMPETATVTMHTNRQAAVRALSLLLDNAMKFTHPAEAAMKVAGGAKKMERASLEVVQNGDNRIDFIVSDTGIGVPPEEAEHIFEEFVQLDDYYDGTGIGLTVARSLARRLGGDVVLDTTYTDGARFILSLPE